MISVSVLVLKKHIKKNIMFMLFLKMFVLYFVRF